MSKKYITWIIIFITTIFIVTSIYFLNNNNDTTINGNSHQTYSNKPDDKVAQQIIDILENSTNYKGKKITLEAQIFNYANEILLGREIKTANGELLLHAIEVNYSTIDLPTNFNNGDWFKVKCKIQVEEKPHGDHSHSIPVINVISLESIKPSVD